MATRLRPLRCGSTSSEHRQPRGHHHRPGFVGQHSTRSRAITRPRPGSGVRPETMDRGLDARAGLHYGSTMSQTVRGGDLPCERPTCRTCRHRHPRPRAGRGRGRHSGVRCSPHRPHLPGGRESTTNTRSTRDTRPRASSKQSARASLAWPRRFRDPQLARRVRTVSRLQTRPSWYCFDTFNADQKMTLTDGTDFTPHSESGRSPTSPWFTRPSAPGRRRSRSRRGGSAGLRRHGRYRRSYQHRCRRS